MKLMTLPDWYRHRPRLVRHTVRATIYRAPVDEVRKVGYAHLDSRQVRAAGVVRSELFLVLGTPNRDDALTVCMAYVGLREKQELIQSPRKLRRDVAVDRGDVVIFEESLA